MSIKNFIEKYNHSFLKIGIALEVIVLIISFIENGTDWSSFFRTAARISGRVSLLYFSLVFIYAAMDNPTTNRIESARIKRTLSGNFAIVHVIHWLLLAMAMKLSHFEVNILKLIPGTLAYFIIIVFPFILDLKSLKRASINLIQDVCLYYIWTVFFYTYLARILGKSQNVTGTLPAYIVMMIFTLSLLLWRLYLIILKRKRIHNLSRQTESLNQSYY